MSRSEKKLIDAHTKFLSNLLFYFKLLFHTKYIQFKSFWNEIAH